MSVTYILWNCAVVWDVSGVAFIIHFISWLYNYSETLRPFKLTTINKLLHSAQIYITMRVSDTPHKCVVLFIIVVFYVFITIIEVV